MRLEMQEAGDVSQTEAEKQLCRITIMKAILLVVLLGFIGVAFGAECHPECTWQCDDPVCPAQCHPVCKHPRCQMQCEETPCAQCTVKCEKPECTVRCPKDMCESDSCPQCETVCSPAKCHTSCIAPEPVCSPLCEETQCDWKCKKPVMCPKPKCELQCEKPACEAQNPTPPSTPSCCTCSTSAIELGRKIADSKLPTGSTAETMSAIEVQHHTRFTAKEMCCPCGTA